MATLSDPERFGATRAPGTHLVGVLIEIPQPCCSALQRMRVQAGDEAADRSRPHVTLLPPTVVTASELAALPDHLAAVAAGHARFGIELSGMGTFRPVSPVVFACVTQGARQCTALEEAVRSGPLAVQARFDYHPHVTVAHNLPDPVLDQVMQEHADFHARFEISGFECFEWKDDDWRLLDAYHLTGMGSG